MTQRGHEMQDKRAKLQGSLLAPGAALQRDAAMLSVLSALIWPLQAALVAYALGGLLNGGHVSPLATALGFAALGLVRAALGLWAEMRAQAAAELVVAQARAQIVSAEARRGADSGFGGAGSIAALAGEKLDFLRPYVTRYAPARARAMVLPLGILALVFWQSWAVGLVLLISGPLIPVFMALVGLAAKEASVRQMAEIGTMNDLLIERLSALVDIRLLGAGGTVLANLAAQSGDLRARTMAVLRVAFLSSTVLELFAAIGVAMVAVYVGFSLLGTLNFGAWGQVLSPEAGIFLLLLAPEFFQPLRDLSAAWHDKAAASAVMDELADWHAATTPDLPGLGGRAEPLSGSATISLRGCFTQAGQPLPDISIAAGERVALVGPSGVGKSSALRLMAGLEQQSTGSIIVAGQNLTVCNADRWRARLGWMPQTPHFLLASLQENIVLHRDGDLEVTLAAAAVRDVVDSLPQGAATRLGEAGGGLSGGEARRVTLARAIYGSPDVILADEPTADLDATTALAVTEALLAQATRGATLVVATHDMALAAYFDRIIYLGASA